jgi:hypothetical protein
MYETVMGSQAYGVAVDNSDFDTCGFCIPAKEMLFPHLRGDIPDFGRQIQRFGVYQQHHVFDPDALGGKGRTEYLRSPWLALSCRMLTKATACQSAASWLSTMRSAPMRSAWTLPAA